MRLILALLVAICAGNARAQIISKESLHFKADGTVVRGQFMLVNRVVPLPEGDFTLITADFRDSRFVRGDFSRSQHRLVTVVLGQMAEGKLRAAVVATTVLTYANSIGWVMEPCKEDKVVLYRLSRVPFMKRNYEQNCLIVNRVARGMGSNASGAYAAIRDWTKEKGGEVPIEMRLDAVVTRISHVEYLLVHYAFNPAAYGCDAANLQSEDFANGVIAFGKAMQVAINEGFAGHLAATQSLAATAPRLSQDCGKARPPSG